MSDYNVIKTDIGRNGCIADERCKLYKQQMENVLVGKYFFSGESIESKILECAYIDLKFNSFNEYKELVKKVSKGNSIRRANIAQKNGFYSKIIEPSQYIDQIVEINNSKEMRCGKEMTAAYQRTEVEVRNYAKTASEYKKNTCLKHYDLWWGVFAKDKLVGYIRLRRNGNYVLFAQILGHGEYLSQNIMYNLHFSILEWLLNRNDQRAQGVRYVIYAAWESGGEGLQRWKRKMGFQPGFFQVVTGDN